MNQDRVGIIGIGQSPFAARRPDANYPDLVREAVVIAMADAKLDFDAIEAVVYSLSPDAMIGIGNAERLGVDAVGGRNKRFLRINTGGATGISSVSAAYYHVASGACDVVLTAGADKVGECGDSQSVLNKIWDPTYERQLPLGTINMLAMSAIRYMKLYGMTEEDMARVTVKNRRHASLNPNAHLRKEVTIQDVLDSRYISWPIKLLDCCPQSTGGAALVLASEKYIRDHHLDAVWITGLAHCAETYWMGDRMGANPTAEHADAYALSRSFQRAYKMAGITDPAKQVHVAELYAPFSNTEFHSIDAAGLTKPGESVPRLRDGEFDLGGRLPVNASGGTLCTNAIAVTAMARVAETALQVWARAGARQAKGARVGIASGNGGDHQIFGTMVIEA
ncbi:MAG: thiolase family protein [Acetobacteraceae bacterium]|nr:thiolase family protein [Acetobacteraceae bacterium]MSP29138.1 thiolase family protein [Acetobacteraceae bacterium]